MADLTVKVQQEVESVHAFFERWFMGRAQKEELRSFLEPRIPEQMLFIDPDGNQTIGSGLMKIIEQAHGSNSEFRLRVRDVRILYETPDHLLVNYTEWQTGAKRSVRSSNGRVATALLTNANNFQWLHIHETWLPEAVQAEGDYSFAGEPTGTGAQALAAQ